MRQGKTSFGISIVGGKVSSYRSYIFIIRFVFLSIRTEIIGIERDTQSLTLIYALYVRETRELLIKVSNETRNR